MLQVDDLTCGYRGTAVVRNVSIGVGAGKCACVVGPNGAGKSTLVHNIVGMHRAFSGRVLFHDQPITHLGTEDIARLGIGLVPEGRRIFASMTVQENLMLGGTMHQGDVRHAALLEEIFTYFPILRDRLHRNAGKLSGGEQQMLSIARALLMRPTLMIIDEPSLGLAPLIVKKVYEVLLSLKARGDIALLIVEQSAARVAAIADTAYVLRNGEIAATLTGESVADAEQINAAYFGADTIA